MSAPPIVRAVGASRATLVARNLCLTHGGSTVLDDVSLTVVPGTRLGVVGPNGAGKSTLLRVLAGLDTPDSGVVERQPAATTVGYLRQEPDHRSDESVRSFVHRTTGVAAAEAELVAASEALAAAEPGADDRFDVALTRHVASGASDLDARLGVVADDLGLHRALLDRPTALLSGGEAARVGLMVVLLARFDIVLLDEPTNDLDLPGLARLEEHLQTTPSSVVLVSHDRAFLERTVTSVAELDGHGHHLTVFSGGWQAYLDLRASARTHAEEDYATYVERRDRLRDRAATERRWAERGVRRAASSGEQDKFIRHHRTQTSEQLAARARRTEQAMERLEVVDKPWEGWHLRLTFTEAPRSGAVVASCRGLVVERDGFRLGPLDLEITAGERVAVLGANGAGKSTLLAALVGELAPDAGHVVLGPSVVVGLLDQRRTVLADPTAGGDLERAFVAVTGLDRSDARSLLAKFGLGAAHVGRQVGELSPGERTRAELARFVARGVNTLVLDEPTNHLDLEAIEQLESALATFGGTTLLVSHDRRFLDAVAPTRRLELRDGRIVADVDLRTGR